jgi:predicted MFS family arabinose efflux permease
MAYSYRAVLREPQAGRVFGAALLGRLSYAMGPLSLVLFVQSATRSFAIAGAASAATALTSGLLAPLRGRLVDRHGQSRTLPVLSLVYAAAFAGVLLVAGRSTVREGSTVLLAAVAGATAPPLAASMRVLWVSLVGSGPRLQAALALDSVVEQVLLTVGPLLAGGLAAAFSSAVPLAAVAALAVAGTTAFTTSAVSRAWTTPGAEVRSGGWAGALSGRGIRTLVISLAGFGAALGIFDITLVAAAREAGSTALGGVLLGLLAAGSVVGGLWYGRRQWRLGPSQRFVRILGLLVLASALLPLARPLPLLGIAVVLVGLLLAPLDSSAYVLAAELAPAGTMTEAATWVTTANNVTAAAGIALAGVLVGGPGVAWTLALACACLLVAFLIAVAGRARLRAGHSLTHREPTQARRA